MRTEVAADGTLVEHPGSSEPGTVLRMEVEANGVLVEKARKPEYPGLNRLVDDVENGASDAGAGTSNATANTTVRSAQGAAASRDGLGELRCGRTLAAEVIPLDMRCPGGCPFLAEDGREHSSCYFKCVRADECGQAVAQVHPNQTVADPMKGICRKCKVLGCAECVPGLDECGVCATGYALQDGRCRSSLRISRYVFLCLFNLVVLVLVIWLLDLCCCRCRRNPEGVYDGLHLRSRAKLRQPKPLPHRNPPDGEAEGPRRAAAAARGAGEAPTQPLVGGDGAPPADAAGDAGPRPLWPLGTNLLMRPCGGPGLVLHMRYQVFIMLLAMAMLFLWLVMAFCRDFRLLSLGLRVAKTSRELCDLVHEGHEIQLATLGTKQAFLFLVYVGGFIAAIAFAISQLRTFQALDDQTTMKDFAAFITGLPRLGGQEPVEDQLRDFLSQETGEQLVGISVCWDFEAEEVKVAAALDTVVSEREAALASAQPPAEAAPTPTEEVSSPEEDHEPVRAQAQEAPQPAEGRAEQPPEQQPSGRRRIFGPLDDIFLDPGLCQEGKEFQARGEEGIVELVQGLHSTGYAFAIFRTETARDAAVSVIQSRRGVDYQGSRLHLRKIDAEPDTVRWRDFSVSESQRPRRLFCGLVAVFGVLIILTLCLYLPNMAYQLSYTFQDENSQPSGSSSYMMMLVVIIGNQILYQACATISDRVGFHFEDDREATYMVFYTIAMFVTIILDMCITAYVAYKMMLSSNAHTYGGKLVGDLDSMQEVYESFPIQNALGLQLWQYCFPSTFIAGYIAEICIIIVPYHIQSLVLGAYPGVRGHQAERSMGSWMVMDTGRYADLLVNLILVMLIFFVPSGYYFRTMGALILSHIYIYVYDHWRILRSAPAFYYAGRTIDNCAQRILAMPLGICLTCLVHKLNMQACDLPGRRWCLDADLLGMVCLDAFAGHIVLHWACLQWVVPLFRRRDCLRSEYSFEELALCVPNTWFSTNPVHCLRSRSFYKHDPPCSYHVRGKEHLMQANPKANSHFTDGMAKSEWD